MALHTFELSYATAWIALPFLVVAWLWMLQFLRRKIPNTRIRTHLAHPTCLAALHGLAPTSHLPLSVQDLLAGVPLPGREHSEPYSQHRNDGRPHNYPGAHDTNIPTQELQRLDNVDDAQEAHDILAGQQVQLARDNKTSTSTSMIEGEGEWKWLATIDTTLPNQATLA